MDSKASETRARVKITPREKRRRHVWPFLAWDDFHARSPFARANIPEQKWGLLVVYINRSHNFFPLTISIDRYRKSIFADD